MVLKNKTMVMTLIKNKKEKISELQTKLNKAILINNNMEIKQFSKEIYDCSIAIDEFINLIY